MIKDRLPNGILLTNIWYCTAHMEKNYKYYEIGVSEDSCRMQIDTVSQNNINVWLVMHGPYMANHSEPLKILRKGQKHNGSILKYGKLFSKCS